MNSRRADPNAAPDVPGWMFVVLLGFCVAIALGFVGLDEIGGPALVRMLARVALVPAAVVFTRWATRYANRRKQATVGTTEAPPVVPPTS